MTPTERAEKILRDDPQRWMSGGRVIINETDIERVAAQIAEAEREAIESYQKSPERQKIRDIDFEHGFRAALEKAARK